MKNVLLVVLICIGFPTLGQSMKTTAQQKMAPLSWLIGEWSGEGSMTMREKKSFKQKETIEMILNGTAIQLKGVGFAGKDTVHEAFAIFYWDLQTQSYKMASFTGDGRNTVADAVVENNKLIWRLKIRDGNFIKYTIWQNEKKHWVETGEMEKEDSKSGTPFFEMTLTRK
ncbi:hypothetical protein QNI19_17075 [Cytophagaceae bacterium DM2B3-1]|uniref:THAP4-like heme-binding domain-containing protein n=1 Tax=Xanthocytophaga flava TaxID=3048013 RepID=A0ABT7CNU0_9BACT|nr:hypothetical protein [Xanthocytophaga flavus]MDJ1468295.1 hypothetical protein [Xanthocytophaga flavus]MDJ1494662.1 hypothetical protein [Xanthocytophaga flavus]